MFIVWDQPAAQPEGRLIVFDGATGIRLDDRHVAEKDVVLIAQAVATHVDAALEKQQLIRDAQLRLISLTSLRNVNLPPQMQARADQFISQLEQSITQHPNCGLLERARLRYVVREKSLPIAQKQAHLLGAAHTVTVELSQSGANQWAVKLLVHQAGQDQPLTIEEKLTLDGGAGDTQATARLTEKLGQLKVDDTSRFSEEQRRQFEIAALMRDANRLMVIQDHLEAATRFEAAYALGEKNYALYHVSIALRYHVLKLSGGYFVSTGLIAQTATTKSIPPERWFEIAELANYRLDLLDTLNEMRQEQTGWPWVDSKTHIFNMLISIDGMKSLIPGNAVALVRSEELPSQYESLQGVYLRGYDQLFQKHSNDIRRKLIGDDLLRFNQHLLAYQLFRLAETDSRHYVPDWADRFVEVFTENLQQDLWIDRTDLVADAVKQLPVPQRERLLSRFDNIDADKFPGSSLTTRYIKLLLRNTDRKSSRQELDTRLVQLAEQIAAEYAKPEANVPGAVQGTISAIRNDISPYRAFLGRLLRNTIELVQDQDLAQSTRESLFLSLLREDVIQQELLSNISASWPRAASEETLSEAINLVDAKDLGEKSPWKRVSEVLHRVQSEANSPMQNLPVGSRNLPFLWNDLNEIPLAEAGQTPTMILSMGIHEGNLFVASTANRSDRKVVVLQIHRQSLTVKEPPEQFVALEFPLAKIQAGTLQVGSLIRGAEFFKNVFEDSILGVSDQYVVLPTLADGLYLFPLAGGPHLRFGVEEGLPSNFVQCAVLLNDKVFAWVGLPEREANFVSIDIASRKVQLIASCQREQKLPPLGNMTGANFTLMPPPPNSQHLVMLVVDAESQLSVPDPRNGAWVFHIAESTFTQIPLPGVGELSTSGPVSYVIRKQDHKTVQATWIQIDPVTRKPSVIPSQNIGFNFQPIWCSSSFNWWRPQYRSICYRQDLATGKITKCHFAVPGSSGTSKVQFHQNENTAIIQMGTRIWIARDFQLQPE